MSATVNLKKHSFSKLSCNNTESLETILLNVKKKVISHAMHTYGVYNVVFRLVIWYRPWWLSAGVETRMKLTVCYQIYSGVTSHDCEDSSLRLLAVLLGAKPCSPIQVFGGTCWLHIEGRICPSTCRCWFLENIRTKQLCFFRPYALGKEERKSGYYDTCSTTRPCFTPFCFDFSYQFTPLPNLRSLIFCSTSFGWFTCIY